MKHLIRRLSRVADSSSSTSTLSSSSSSAAAAAMSSYALLRSDSLSSPRPRRRIGRRRKSVPSGHVPVYVGEEMERFVVSADLMNHPVFVKLLNKSAQEYGYEQKGALRIPCNVVVFEKVLEALRCGGADFCMEVHDLINSSSDELFL